MTSPDNQLLKPEPKDCPIYSESQAPPPCSDKAQELCESRGGRPGLPVPNKPDGFRGHKATLERKICLNRSYTRLNQEHHSQWKKTRLSKPRRDQDEGGLS